MDGFIIKRTKYKADFWLPQYSAYVEYWGLVYTERYYAQKMRHKFDYYRRHKLRLISVYPNNISNLDSFLKGELHTHCTNCGQVLKPADAYCISCGTKTART